MIIDKPLAELEQYKPSLTRQHDFDAFWEQTLNESDNQPLNATLEEVPYPVERVTVYQVRYDGFGSATRITGWYLVPKDRYRVGSERRTPTIVQYHGYSGGKGVPGSYLHWALQGYCVFTVDTRGQTGDTPDNAHYPSGSFIGYMTKGIDHSSTYYYRYVYMDCVRALDFLKSRPEVGPIALTGASQGGGLTLAVAALALDRGVVAAMPDVPFLCHFERAVEVFLDGPYQELVQLWKMRPTTVPGHYRTLSYFDGMNLAPRITCPILMSVALLDRVCPPSTGFAVYNHLTSTEKEMRVYPYNGHEGGGAIHEEEKYRFVRKYLMNV
jgi:cephalosporin-C deacetylase